MSVRNKFVETKPYSTNVMSDISKALSKNKIQYSSNSKSTELSIKLDNKITKDKVLSAIEKNVSIPSNVLSVLTDNISVKDQMYIRQTVQ